MARAMAIAKAIISSMMSSQPIEAEGIGGQDRQDAGAGDDEQEIEHGFGLPNGASLVRPGRIKLPYGLGRAPIRKA